MSKIDYQALREIAEKATPDEWVAFISTDTGTYAVHTPGDERCEDVIKWTGFDGQKNAENNARYVAAFNPKVALALLDERERNQQYIKRRDQENEEIALTVGKLRVELEGKDSKIANLTAERDALREGEMGDARHSNTRAAADIYFQLVEECEIPAGGSLVEYVDDMREKLEAAEKRIAELESGSQAQKLVEAIIVAIENEQERLFDEDYLMDSKECIAVIREEVKRWNDSRAAGIRIKGE
ncbi:ead/Ea22-like family protein [Escherichia coli]|nr:ead/Ea22-like family protein [Escherichia coli]MDT4652362.1 ead/Ea22-like family protein [Escherichia coli]